MDKTFRILIATALVLSVMLFISGILRIWQKATKSRAPMDNKLLRSAGESLRSKLEALNERLIFSLAFFLFLPFSFAWGVPTNVSTPVFLCILFPLVLLSSIPMIRIIVKYRNYALGLRGERAVGEELNQLMMEGCHVFHDYPANPKWNIDHVVIAPSGVYSIETKTRRKRRAPKGKREHEITFDGARLHFPHCTDNHGLEQSRANASWLSRELTSATGEPVKAKPVLTFPGWLVTLRGKGDVTVLNPKQIRQVILNAPLQLSPAQMQRIAHQVEQKCRDVEM